MNLKQKVECKMRVGVIRGDISGALLMDLESVSQYNPAIEPKGQERKVSRPNVTVLAALLSQIAPSASASALIAATLPVGGPLDVREATIRGVSGIGGSPSVADITRLADAIAPRFIETDIAVKSFQVGMLHGYRSASFNPDPSRYPALANGPAVVVVQDDGFTPFTAPLTAISAASASGGNITITGTNLANPEVRATVIRVSSADGTKHVRIYQKTLQATAGSTVSLTSIVVPAALLNGLGVAGSKVLVQNNLLPSNTFTVT